jgi:hypothetical protein
MAFSVASALEMDIFSKCKLLTGDAGWKMKFVG